MGLELVFGVAALAVGVISGLNQMESAKQTTIATQQASQAYKEAAVAQKEANQITQAQQQIISVEDRRQRVREERLRRNTILQASKNTTGGGNSGESGAVSALGANMGTLVAQSRSQTKANLGVSEYNQKALDAEVKGREIMATAQAKAGEADAFSSFLNIFQTGLRAF